MWSPTAPADSRRDRSDRRAQWNYQRQQIAAPVGLSVRCAKHGLDGDPGDGTITDRQTCLVWEKHAGNGGMHDTDNTFTWSSGGNDPDGTAVTSLLAPLHTPTCLAGHCDWRLLSEEGRNLRYTGPMALENILMDPCSAAVRVTAGLR